MKNSAFLLFVIGFVLLAMGRPCSADDKIDYLKQIKPILAAKCYSCHGALKQEAELRVETLDLILKGGDSGDVLIPGKPSESLLLERIAATGDEQMPPPGEGSRVSAKERALIKIWIDQGAKAPHEEPPGDPKQHWSFLKPERPKVPHVNNLRWTTNPIDAFLTSKQEKRKLIPVRQADKRIVLRRLYLDLIGLPPTLEELHAFDKDHSEQAYEKIVQNLINRPQYGERWGRHWMDVWRYSDWYGLGQQLRYSQKHIWRWRDWIVESLNTDKAYDRMIVEMLAGDEIAPTDPKVLRATGFLARHYYIFNRTTWLDNTVEHTSKAFLGLTMNCCKCHDHKYDPIQQTDYYRMRSIFEPYQVRLDPIPGETNLDKNGLPRIYDAHPEKPTYVQIRGNAKDLDKTHVITPGVPEVLAFEKLKIQPINLPPEVYNPALQAFVLEDHLKLAEQKIKIARASVVKAEQTLAAAEKAAVEKAAAVVSKEKHAKPATAEIFLNDNFDKPDENIWETGEGDWKYVDGKLVQSQTGASRKLITSRADHPVDFEARLKFKTTGGDKWRSVGIGFDVGKDHDKMVYMSAVMPGSKVQFTHKTGEASVYPPKAGQARPVQLNEPYELTIAVRGQLLNVAVNGKHAFAHQMSVKRQPGRITLVAFDATVEFDAVTIRSLPTETKLVAAGVPKNKTATPANNVKTAKDALELANKQLKAAELHPNALRTAHSANITKEKTPKANNLSELIQAAAIASSKYDLAAAELAVAQAETKAAASNQKTKAAARKAVKAAQDKLKKAQTTAEKPGENYTSLTVSRRGADGLADKIEKRHGPYSKISTGRRTAFARWIANSKNPLTARVAVNHIWMRHFGQPLVESVTDFGIRAPQPLHHDLLDWLAVEFMEHNWSMKHIHQLIVTSQAYQLSSSTLGADETTKSADAENHFYWRRNSIRMESQVIRDSFLQLANLLDTTLGGPTINPKNEDSVYRRSFYFKQSGNDRQKFIAMFDDADIFSCYRRSESVVPQQALALANSKLAMKMSREITAHLQRTLKEMDDDRFITTAFQTILATHPTKAEITACRGVLIETRKILVQKKHENHALRARENLVHALLNHNDFITIR